VTLPANHPIKTPIAIGKISESWWKIVENSDLTGEMKRDGIQFVPVSSHAQNSISRGAAVGS
jgi:hypothetical protein